MTELALFISRLTFSQLGLNNSVTSQVATHNEKSREYDLYMFGVDTSEQRVTVHVNRILVLDAYFNNSIRVLPGLESSTELYLAKHPFEGKVAYGRVYDAMIAEDGDTYVCNVGHLVKLNIQT